MSSRSLDVPDPRHGRRNAIDRKLSLRRIGPRFRLRKLFLRQLEFSTDELEFIVEYLERETTLPNQAWWSALSLEERLEIAGKMKLYTARREEEQVIWLSSVEANKGCILIYGKAEARPVDIALAPVLKFTEGAVMGNLALPSHLSLPHGREETETTSTAKWRALKGENTLRSSTSQYSKLVIIGPADYLMLKSTDILETIAGAADRIERDSWARAFGLGKLAGCLRHTTFEPGTCIVAEGEESDALYLIVHGECRASVASSGPSVPSSSTTASEHTRENGTRHRRLRLAEKSQLPIASLGPKSSVGEISLTMDIGEPATVRAITTVEALALSRSDFANEVIKEKDESPVSPLLERLRAIAYDTLKFVVGRIEFEASHQQSNHTDKIDNLRAVLIQNTDASESRAWVDANERSKRMQRPRSSSNAGDADGKNLLCLPSVVQRHQQVASTLRGQDASVEHMDDGRLVGPEARKSTQQLKAAQAFGNLQSPVAAKSMLDSSLFQLQSITDARTAHSTNEQTHEDDLLFLTPTMTLQRQLHAKTLPLLPRYYGFDPTPNNKKI